MRLEASVTANGTTAFKQLTIGCEDLSTAAAAGAKSSAVYYVSGDQTNDRFFAKTGSYTVAFKYTVVNTGKTETKTQALKVINSLYIPKVDVKNRTVDSVASGTDIVKNLAASVDLNNKTSVSDSIDPATTAMYATYTNNAGTAATPNNNRVIIKYVTVYENIDATHEVAFLIPINATFTAR